MMNSILLLGAIVLIACVIGSKISTKLGIPTLLFFIGLGMLFGSEGLFKIDFENYFFAEKICSAALIFIMFYGGFGTKWSTARPVALKATLLSTLGTLITAILTGLFCHVVFKLPLLEGMLIGSVLSSTDAASVFSILRSQRLNLKYGTAPLLEIESGSNDPCAYMMTILLLSAMGGDILLSDISYSIFAQLAYGLIIGVALAFIGSYVLRHIRFGEDGFDSIFLVAIALAAYALPSLIGGNGYLSAYIAGIILGNQRIPQKKNLVNFFDAFNGIMQMVIFFLLGLLVFPSNLILYFVPALLIALFLTFIARPVAVAILLTPFKAPLNQQHIISWAGLRGAASIVFAIIAVVSPNYHNDSIFSVVFCVVLLSLLFQGALLPRASKKLNMIDDNENVLKTFNDYSDENDINFIRLDLKNDHPWVGKQIREIGSIPGALIAAILRQGATITPKGNTILKNEDSLIICAKSYQDKDSIKLNEIIINADSLLIGKKLKEADIGKDSLVVLIQRNGTDIIPDGNSEINAGDVLVVYSQKNLFHLA